LRGGKGRVRSLVTDPRIPEGAKLKKEIRSGKAISTAGEAVTRTMGWGMRRYGGHRTTDGKTRNSPERKVGTRKEDLAPSRRQMSEGGGHELTQVHGAILCMKIREAVMGK